ncbi:MAG: type II toxin-antitoxin system RatA family toxin [Gammaproteobacteria bacterium]|nr:type II toxin-antitoxin system RatA family toxin [Gammaproteobacteria bacterium]
MAYHEERRMFPYTAEQMFELVADVESYPEFLPLWHEARTRPVSNRDSWDIYRTSQIIQLGPIRRRFSTETRMWRPKTIEINSSDTFFKLFSIEWDFEPLPNNHCRVEFRLRCEAGSRLMKPVFELVLTESAQTTMHAFQKRARMLYAGQV